jgi:hypothetical protein
MAGAATHHGMTPVLVIARRPQADEAIPNWSEGDCFVIRKPRSLLAVTRHVSLAAKRRNLHLSQGRFLSCRCTQDRQLPALGGARLAARASRRAPRNDEQARPDISTENDTLPHKPQGDRRASRHQSGRTLNRPLPGCVGRGQAVGSPANTGPLSQSLSAEALSQVPSQATCCR